MWDKHQRTGRPSTRRMVAGVALVALVSACGGSPPSTPPAAASLDSPDIAAALKAFQGSQIKQHMSVLADDGLEGRGLGTPGYEAALQVRRKDGHGPRTRAGRRKWRLPAAGAAAQQRGRRERKFDEGAFGGRHQDPGLRQRLPGQRRSPCASRSASTTRRSRSSATASAPRRSATTTTTPAWTSPAKWWRT